MTNASHHRRFLNLLIAFAAWGAFNCPVTADEFPLAVRGKTAAQMKALVERAATENMIVSEIKVRASRSRQLFECEFQKNTDNIPWLILLNISETELQTQQADLLTKNYFPVIERSVTFQDKKLYTVVWQKKQEDRPLVIPAGPVPESGLKDERLNPFDELMSTFIKQNNVAGATLAVAKNGRLVYARGFGYSDINKQEVMQPDSVMRIASISKPITAVATLMLIEEGKLSLDTPVLPVLKTKSFQLSRTGDQRWADITVRHLLQHSGGWDRDISPDPMFQIVNITRKEDLKRAARRKDILRYQLSQPLDFAPGERYAYSNFGYSVLAQVLEAVTDMPYEDFIKQRVLTPCKMLKTQPGKTRLEDRLKNEVRYYPQTISTHTPFWSVPERAQRGAVPKIAAPVEAPYGQWDLEVMDAHGGWTSTAPDLLRLVAALDSRQQPLLNEASLITMAARPQLQDTTSGSSIWYGCGWNVRPIRPAESALNQINIWHNGALAGTSTLLVRRSDGMSWAVLFNTDKAASGERLATQIDGPIHSAVNRVFSWPDHNLFERKTLN